jgi:pyruvate,water dikinase
MVTMAASAEQNHAIPVNDLVGSDGVAPYLLVVGGTRPMPGSLVGGKAEALHRLATAGLSVPSAVVLTTAFFAPWLDTIRTSPAWKTLVRAPRNDWPSCCAALQAELGTLQWTPEQVATLSRLGDDDGPEGEAVRFAVRSSSPDEDQETASFAGMYRSCLGVCRSDLEQAIRRCFASCMEAPVLAYKAAQGLPVFEPAIAVIIQQQIDSEVSGVGFSIHPLTNDYDELFINASWGLGEMIVDGRVMGDQFILDKMRGGLLKSTLGSKLFGSELAPAGGTRPRSTLRSDELCLTLEQLAELASTISSIEDLFGRPVDVEFAYAADTLYLLQARPVTTWVPLAATMMSAPGAPRTLYMDISLAKGITTNAPLSPMGQDWLRHTVDAMVRHFAGDIDFPLDRGDGWLCIDGGRMYLNVSRILWLTTPRQLAHSNAPTDELLGRTLEAVDIMHYRAPVRPSWLPLVRMLPGILWKLRRTIWRSIGAFAAPERAYRRYRAREREVLAGLSAPLDHNAPLPVLQRQLGQFLTQKVVETAMPAMIAGIGASGALARLARRDCEEEQRLVARLARGTSGNMVVEMSIAMFHMARLLPPADFNNLELLHDRIARRELPPAFLAAWQRFMETYGCRGPGEMDLANPGYRDDPLMLLGQMASMADASGAHDPEAAHKQLATQREAAYLRLLQLFGPVRRLLLRRLYATSSLFAGTRDTPKHFLLLARQRLRERALATGEALVAAGRLDRPRDVFGLRYTDLDPTPAGPVACLRQRLREHGAFPTLLSRHVKTFPALIDSRGRILRPPPAPTAPGQLRGVGMSAGVVRGRVKCLRTANEKIVTPGDILVAFTTDPGWTPLFVSAAAIVLEVGGVLQHGALVARELNKPCVAGIAQIFEHLHDGQLVEVDGMHGVISIIDAM